MRTPFWMIVAYATAACAACSGDPVVAPRDAAEATSDAESDTPDARDDAAAPDGSGEACAPGSFWSPGVLAFTEATADWGLAGVEGTRLAVADLDADGWPDLVVRRGGSRFNDYGAGVRNLWVLRNDHGRFVDITADTGFDDRRRFVAGVGRPLEVVAFADVDNDGDLDVYTGVDTVSAEVSAGESSEILLNNGAAVFSLTPESNPLRRRGAVDAPASATFVDVDRDGLVDLWVPQHEYTPADAGLQFAQDRLYRGVGAGVFEDVTGALGLTTEEWNDRDELDAGLAHSRAWSGVACDLNGDGDPELLASSYGRAPNHLWVAQRGEAGAVHYVNAGVASGYAYDQDQTWTDNQFALCFCADNPDAEDCDGLPEPQITCSASWRHAEDRRPYRLGGNSGTTVCSDLDNDGWLDLLTTEIKHWWAGNGADASNLLINLRDPAVRFDLETPREARGFLVRHRTSPSWDEGHMTAGVLDFDNDGWPDFYVGGSDYAGNYGLLYHQASPGVWEEVPVEDGFEHNRSHGVAIADFDRDGDLDLIVGHSRARCDAAAPNDCYATAEIRAFSNTIGARGNWVQLDLEGAGGSNRSAIGARVTLTAAGVTQTQEVGGGFGHFGMQNDRVLHFGLGAACAATVGVRWPDAELTEESFSVTAGGRYSVVRGAGARRVPAAAGP